jgi:hypothetical protein
MLVLERAGETNGSIDAQGGKIKRNKEKEKTIFDRKYRYIFIETVLAVSIGPQRLLELYTTRGLLFLYTPYIALYI